MRTASLLSLGCAMCMFGGSAAPTLLTTQTASPAKATPLILEKDEGDRRVWRIEGFLHHFVLEVDSESGNSSHLVFGTGGYSGGRENRPASSSERRRDPLLSEWDRARTPGRDDSRGARRRDRFHPGRYLDFRGQHRKRADSRYLHLLRSGVRQIHARSVDA